MTSGADDARTFDDDDGAGFLGPPVSSPDVRRIFDGDMTELGYVMNLSRLWAHQPELQTAMSGLVGAAADAGSLSLRQKGVLVVACASTLGDAYCSLAWGNRLAGEVGADAAAGVALGDDQHLDESDRALARWARLVANDPNSTTAGDVQVLRDTGFRDAQIFAITAYVAARIAFSTVNDALGARPDAALNDAASEPVRSAVTFGRAAATGPQVDGSPSRKRAPGP